MYVCNLGKTSKKKNIQVHYIYKHNRPNLNLKKPKKKKKTQFKIREEIKMEMGKKAQNQ